jgi:Asp/Glu/hydantoin racemase
VTCDEEIVGQFDIVLQAVLIGKLKRSSARRSFTQHQTWFTRGVRTVAFLHTADVHVATFSGLLSEVAPGAKEVHLVDAELLSDARRHGLDAGIEARVLARLRELAVCEPGAIVCTCSTLSGSAERLAQKIETPVVRIDRPMAEGAVAYGGRVALVVAIDSTLAPTRQLFEECAASAGRDVTLVDAPCLDAWERFEAGDHDGYLARIARHVRGLADDVDIVVLAQASMASAADLVRDLSIPVLSSPRLAVVRAVELADA